MKVLITGTTGFIGGFLAQRLSQQYEITAASRADLDLLDRQQTKQFLQDNLFDTVINCASEGRNTPRAFDPTIVDNNLRMYTNLVHCQQYYRKLICFGSGAEFDVDTNIELALEQDVFYTLPTHSYGLSKNIITRLAHLHPKTAMLRIFGCFDSSEGANRPLRAAVTKIQQRQVFEVVNDRWFDMISLEDLARIITAVIADQIPTTDINCVYQKKYKLSTVISMLCEMHGLNSNLVQIKSNTDLHYTGDGSKLSKYNLDLLRLERSLANYQIK